MLFVDGHADEIKMRAPPEHLVNPDYRMVRPDYVD
jgi:hypothetical protein